MMLPLNRRSLIVLGLTALAAAPAFAQGSEFGNARAKRPTVIRYDSEDRSPLPTPPAGVFDLVTYPSRVGPLGAYVTPDPKDGARHPAIIWLTGGETNTVGDVWSPRDRSDDQSAAAYRKAGIVMMFPSLRGGNDNPGQLEGFYGEIDDVLAAADWLAQQPWVDPDRIYLGGHSTGGTLAFLVAEASSRFRATFAFGAVGSALKDYGSDFVPVDLATLPSKQAIDEVLYRAPGYWMKSVTGKLFAIEGTVDSNIAFVEVAGADHFSVLAPANEVIAQKIKQDKGATTSITLTGRELKKGVR